jgi:hypothetical protein
MSEWKRTARGDNSLDMSDDGVAAVVQRCWNVVLECGGLSHEIGVAGAAGCEGARKIMALVRLQVPAR